jgi:predicted Zn-dependent protease
MSENPEREILEQVLSYSHADDCEVSLNGFTQAATRFANNAITQNLERTNRSLTVSVAFGQRAGQASVNDFSPESLKAAVERADAIAQFSEPDPEYMPPPGPSSYAEGPAYFAATAEMSPQGRADAIREAAEHCAGRELNSAGSYTTEVHTVALANDKGMFASRRSTSARFIVTVMSPDSSGWAESAHEDAGKVAPLDATRRAADKAVAARNPISIEAKPYPVLLEPNAAAEMTAYLTFSMDAKAAHEGRSAFSGKEGDTLFDPSITLRSDPADPSAPVSPFFGDGTPVPPVTWIDQGRLENLAYSRYWAEHTGHAFTGGPTNLLMTGGDETQESLMSRIDRGILVTRFWYIRFVDPMKLLLTGMTRDGLFLIEDGQVTRGIKNMRFNESPIRMLHNVSALGKPARCGEYHPALVPPMVVNDYRFTSGTSF